MNIILAGFLGSFLSGAVGTAFGGVAILFINRFDRIAYSSMLSFSAGVMLAAVFFSLLTPALATTGILNVVFGFVSGVFFLELCDKFIPHEHFLKGREGYGANIKRVSLFIFAIIIHNFPEGLTVGVGFGIKEFHKAVALAVGMGIQNILEGAAVALLLRAQGYSRRYSFLVAALSGLAEPLAGLLGISLVAVFSGILPFTLSFAAGCMLYVISGEIIPECHREGCGKSVKIWLIAGFTMMMLLDNMFK